MLLQLLAAGVFLVTTKTVTAGEEKDNDTVGCGGSDNGAPTVRDEYKDFCGTARSRVASEMSQENATTYVEIGFPDGKLRDLMSQGQCVISSLWCDPVNTFCPDEPGYDCTVSSQQTQTRTTRNEKGEAIDGIQDPSPSVQLFTGSDNCAETWPLTND